MKTTSPTKRRNPPLTDGHGHPVAFAADDAFDQWIEAAVRVLQLWV